MSIPDWFWNWSRWYITTGRDKADRPKDAPEKIPEWAWAYNEEVNQIAHDRGMTDGERDWVPWYLDGKEKGERPNVPDTIPECWWKDAEFVQQQRRLGTEP